MTSMSFKLALLCAATFACVENSRASLPGCVAPFGGTDNINCIGVVQLARDDCARFAQYQGSQLPYDETSNGYCLVPYGSTCPQSITILQQEGNGVFTNCPNDLAQAAATYIQQGISSGQLTFGGSGGSSSSSGGSSGSSGGSSAGTVEQICSMCRQSCAAQRAAVQESGGVLSPKCQRNCPCCTSGNIIDCA